MSKAPYLVLTEQVIEKFRHLLTDSDLHIDIHPARVLAIQSALLDAPAVVAEGHGRPPIPIGAQMRLGPMVIYVDAAVPFDDVWLHSSNQ